MSSAIIRVAARTASINSRQSSYSTGCTSDSDQGHKAWPLVRASTLPPTRRFPSPHARRGESRLADSDQGQWAWP